MDSLAGFYCGMAALTALYVHSTMPARRPGEWIALLGIAVAWPLSFAYAVYWAIRRAVNPSL